MTLCGFNKDLLHEQICRKPIESRLSVVNFKV